MSSAIAEEKSAESAKAARTILAESDKIQALEIRQKPGESNSPTTTTTRVIRALQGGKLLRTYADGKTDTIEWKTGEVQIQGPGPQFTAKNVGSTEIVLYVVLLK
jgi:hypothetical protein